MMALKKAFEAHVSIMFVYPIFSPYLYVIKNQNIKRFIADIRNTYV